MESITQDRSEVRVFQLTPRQRQVIVLLMDGLSRRQIAAVLGLSLGTVRVYCRDILRHYGVSSMREALVCWQRGEVVYG